MSNRILEVMAMIVIARAQVLSGAEEAASAALEALRAAIVPIRSACFEHVLALVEAEHHLRSGDERAAGDALSRALARSGAGFGHARYFFSPADLARLVAEALRRGIEVDAARALVRLRHLVRPADVGAEWPRDLTVRALGTLGVERDGVALDGSARAQRRPLELLGALIAFGGRDVPEERLAEALWPDSDGDTAHHALETALYRLRRLAGKEAVVQRGRRVSLSPERCWVDALELDARLSESIAALDRRHGPVAPTPAAAAAIADLYRGPLLADTDAPWAEAARDQLRRKLTRWLLALERLPGNPAGADRVRRELMARDGGLLAQGPVLRIA